MFWIVGAGERSVNNIDVEVVEQRAYDQSQGNIVSVNSGTNLPFDLGSFNTNASKYYYYKVHNKSSRNTSAFVFGFMIQVSGN